MYFFSNKKKRTLLFFIFNSNYRYGNKIEDKHKNVIVEINNKNNYLFKLRRWQDNNWRFGIHPPESFWIRTLIGIWKQTRQTINHLHSRGIYIYKDPKYLYVEVLALVQKMQDLTQLHTSCKQEKKKSTRRVFARATFVAIKEKTHTIEHVLLLAYGLTISPKHDLSAPFVTTHSCPISANQIMEIGP